MIARRKRSVLIGIAVAYVAALGCGWAVGNLLAARSDRFYVEPVFHAMDSLELQDAQQALTTGGSPTLAAYLARLDRAFGGRHLLLNKNGEDVLTGFSYAGLLPSLPATSSRGLQHGKFYLAQRSEDGLYWLAVISPVDTRRIATWPYFAACLTVTSGLTLFSLFYLVIPLRHIRDVVSRFGRGDRSARIHSARQDEIGQLAAEIDEMATSTEQNLRTERLLLQDISHELRAPLSRLTLAARLAQGKENAQLTPILEQIDSNVHRLSILVGEITDFHQRWSMVENGPPGVVDLREIVESAIDLCRIEADAQETVIEPKLASVILPAAQPELILRVVENLLRNAITYSRLRGRIEVSLIQENSRAILAVRDFGTGIAPEQIENIFDPFFRGDPVGKDKPRGLGLGLSIAKRGVQWHGGTLSAENAKPGLRLTATFPL